VLSDLQSPAQDVVPRRAPTRPRISVVTLLWRNERYAGPFLTTLENAARVAGARVELIAVENGPDGKAAADVLERLASEDAHVSVIPCRSPENSGFSGGANLGCRVATGDILVVANLDLEFDADFIGQIEALRDLVAAPGFLIPSVATSGVGEGGPLRRDRLHRPRSLEREHEAGTRVPAGTGSCIIFGRSAYLHRCAAVDGLFDPEYHSYFEDVDLFWWAEQQAIPAFWAPTVKVVHHQGGSFDGRYRFRDRTPDLRASVMANYRLTVWRHALRLGPLLGWAAGECGYLARCVAYSGPHGLGTYVRSWVVSVQRLRQIKGRRGSWR
jgi:GT2 family glycosyltransferase